MTLAYPAAVVLDRFIHRPWRDRLLEVLTALLLLTNSDARAAVLSFSGDFSGSMAGATDVPSKSGSFSFVVDAGALTGSGFEVLGAGALDSLTFNPSPLGVTAFTIANSSAELIFLDGVLTSLVLGGNVNGVVAVAPATDDWVVAFDAAGSQPLAAATIGSSSAVTFYGESSSSFAFRQIPTTSVPEPSGISTLMALGLVGILSSRVACG